MDVINETVGDAISDMLLVETVLHARGWSAADWNNAYTDLPNRQMKVGEVDHCQVGEQSGGVLVHEGRYDDMVSAHGAHFSVAHILTCKLGM